MFLTRNVAVYRKSKMTHGRHKQPDPLTQSVIDKALEPFLYGDGKLANGNLFTVDKISPRQIVVRVPTGKGSRYFTVQVKEMTS